MSEASVAVGLHGVVKRFGDVVAVDNLDLDIRDGEFFSLLGPSGCGKTTTLRMIAGLELPTAGSVTIHGEEMGIRPPNKRPVNTVFQSYALFPHMDVARNVGFGLEMRKVPKEERSSLIDWAIDLVEMGAMAHRKPAQLSGGQQQRVALARALVNRPEVLLLDEPLGALDLKLRQQMQHELKELQREVGITFVYVTHDQEEAVTMSDRIGVMHDGRLLQVDSPERIYEHPTTRFVADFIGQTNFLEATVASADEVVLANGDRLRLSTDHDGGAAVAVTVRPERLTVHGRDEAPVGAHSLDGVVDSVVYMGNAINYTISVDWMHLEVRCPATLADDRKYEGDEVTVSFDPDHASVVVG
ncbi:MAG: ABC transporter ATP-binding protein [Acidimicrobiales bacterium]|jgi:spermidine/putrescine transport system ATP-binding protein|nr:ABC transporter ATP-binding protein [Acidimicrobiales bacterium]|tara:strand:+ start:11432 stop:12502 length:1071 start_codon:yes stop_codon:yes gene_type:complete